MVALFAVVLGGACLPGLYRQAFHGPVSSMMIADALDLLRVVSGGARRRGLCLEVWRRDFTRLGGSRRGQ